MRARTHAMLAAVTPEILDFAPAVGVRSIGAIASHMFACQATVLTGLANGEFHWKENEARFAGMSLDAMLEISRDLDAMLVGLVTEADDVWLDAVPTGYSLTRSAWLWETLEHEIHHTGQIATLIRLAGGVPARIFG